MRVATTLSRLRAKNASSGTLPFSEADDFRYNSQCTTGRSWSLKALGLHWGNISSEAAELHDGWVLDDNELTFF